MKKLMSIAAASFALSAMAEYSPVIGITEIQTTNKNTIVAVPFSSLNGGAISAGALVCTNNLTTGDALYIYTKGENPSYSAWAMTADGWAPAQQGSLAAGNVSFVGGSASDTLVTGSAIWLVLQTAPSSTKSVYIYGQWETPTEVTITRGSNLIANPLQSAATLNVTPILGDEVIFPRDGTNERYVRRYSKRDKVDVWVDNDLGTRADLPSVLQGQGVWYVTTNTSATVTWTAVSP